ncbi:MAG: hypothetical protein WD749_13405 [Phycisphaerales bacterium]
MEAYKLASLAGSVTMAVFGGLQYSAPVLVQTQQQPRRPVQEQPGRSQQPPPQRPQNPEGQQPNRQNPNQQVPPVQNPNERNPRQQTPQQPVQNPQQPAEDVNGDGVIDANDARGPSGFFSLQNEQMRGQFTQASQQLARLEQQLVENNQRLLRQLGQARLLSGERKADALAEVMQGVLQAETAQMQYLRALREAITGQINLGDDGTRPGQPGVLGTPEQGLPGRIGPAPRPNQDPNQNDPNQNDPNNPSQNDPNQNDPNRTDRPNPSSPVQNPNPRR